MLMKAFAAKVKEEVNKFKREQIEQYDTYQSILNNIFLYNVELICDNYKDSVEEMVFDERNPFVKLLADLNELTGRIKASKILKTPKTASSENGLASAIARELVLCMFNTKGAILTDAIRRGANLTDAMNDFLRPGERPNVDLNIVPLLDMNVITELLRKELAKLPPEDSSIGAGIYWASKRGEQMLVEFLDSEYGDKTKPQPITRPEIRKFIDNVLINYGNAIEGSAAHHNPHTRSNVIRRLAAHYITLADVAAKFNYRDPDADMLLSYKTHNDGDEGANKRYLNYVAGGKDMEDIDIGSKVSILKRKHGYAQYDLSHVNEMLTDSDVYNRLVLFKLFNMYVEDRKKNQGFGFFADHKKIPAASWAINYIMGKTDLHNFERDIPEEYKAAFAQGELAKFKAVIVDSAKKFVPLTSVGLTEKFESARVGL